MQRWAAVLIAFAAACAVSAAAWRFWTPRCTENCADWVSLSMMAWVVTWPLAAAWAAGQCFAPGRRPRTALALVVGVLALAAVAGMLLTRAAA